MVATITLEKHFSVVLNYEVPFFIKQRDSHDVLYARKNNHRYWCNARKDN